MTSADEAECRPHAARTCNGNVYMQIHSIKQYVKIHLLRKTTGHVFTT